MKSALKKCTNYFTFYSNCGHSGKLFNAEWLEKSIYFYNKKAICLLVQSM